MKSKKWFECLRCEHRYQADHEAGLIVERACPKCGSNSVRLEGKNKTEVASRKAPVP